MFQAIGHISGASYTPVLKKFKVYNLAIRKGALLSLTHCATINQESVAIWTTSLGLPILGIATHAVTAAAAQSEVEVEILCQGMEVWADVKEILNDTTLTATGGSATTIADSSFLSIKDNGMIGSKLEVVNKAADTTQNGDSLTVTDWTQSSGTFTFATTTTSFASADTYKLKSLGVNIIGATHLVPDGTYADTIQLNQAIATDVQAWARVVGLDEEKKKLRMLIIAGYDSGYYLQNT